MVLSNGRTQIMILLTSIMQLRQSICKIKVHNAAETVQCKIKVHNAAETVHL
jgi:hypothetical protein